MNAGIELIRIIGVVLISFTHTRNSFDQGIGYYIFEYLPIFGTAVLSIVSGYLYVTKSSSTSNLFIKKVQTLLVPFLIANVSVLILVLLANYITGVNYLNRLGYNFELITEGVFAFNSPPINPPTYFVRDIFVIFCLIALLKYKEWKSLLIIVPLLMFGSLILRSDVAFLFAIGVLYGRFQKEINLKWLGSILVVIAVIMLSFHQFNDYIKFPVSCIVFLLFTSLKFPLFKTGGYSYLLHLYHSPIMVMSYPVINKFITNEYASVIVQVLLAIVVIYILYQLTKRYKKLGILTGYKKN